VAEPSRFRDQRDGSAQPWLFGIAANLLADASRHDRIETRARERLGLPIDLATEDGYEEVDDRLSPRVALRLHFGALPPGERGAVEMRVIEQLSYPDIAHRLSVRPAAARLRVSRALRRLANQLREENEP
jgi:DNA-directed RNA polymerase specialized sigma24 family protein